MKLIIYLAVFSVVLFVTYSIYSRIYDAEQKRRIRVKRYYADFK